MLETVMMLAALFAVAVLGGSSVNSFVAAAALAALFAGAAAWQAAKGLPRAREYAYKTAAALVLIGLLFGLNAANKKAGRAGAEKIAAACEEYRAKTGAYPAALDLLVPDYLGHLPAAKYSLRWSRYWLSGGRVMYASEPGLLAASYDLSAKKWSTEGMYKVLEGR